MLHVVLVVAGPSSEGVGVGLGLLSSQLAVDLGVEGVAVLALQLVEAFLQLGLHLVGLRGGGGGQLDLPGRLALLLGGQRQLNLHLSTLGEHIKPIKPNTP